MQVNFFAGRAADMIVSMYDWILGIEQIWDWSRMFRGCERKFSDFSKGGCVGAALVEPGSRHS
jgi:hypothetical protein